MVEITIKMQAENDNDAIEIMKKCAAMNLGTGQLSFNSNSYFNGGREFTTKGGTTFLGYGAVDKATNMEYVDVYQRIGLVPLAIVDEIENKM